MRRILLTVAACALGLTMTSTAEAHPPRHARAHVYYHDHGVRFSGGYYFSGRNHHHWAYKVWDARCNCYDYWDPDLRCFYYWNAARDCYYPIGW